MVHELSMLPKLGATLFAALTVAALFLSACGDSVGLESAQKVASVSDLGSCTAENAGEAVFVEDERMLYTCGEEGWKAAIEPVKPEESKDSGKTDTVREVVSFPDLDSCTAENAGEEALVKDEGMRYTCGEEGWIAANESAEYGDCGTVVVSDDPVSTCGEDGTFTDSRDGRIYKCVKIGDQVWMAENLDFGEIVRSTANQVKASAAHAQKYCYGDDSTNCAKYGGLYQWHTAMGLCAGYVSMDASSRIDAPHRGICPAGWHVPTQDEWETLVEFVQSPDSNNAGRKLKSKEGWDVFLKHTSIAMPDTSYYCNEEDVCDSSHFFYLVPPIIRSDAGYAMVPGKNGCDEYGWNALPGGHYLYAHSYQYNGPHNSYYSWIGKFVSDESLFWSTDQDGGNAKGYGVKAYPEHAGEIIEVCGIVKDSLNASGYLCKGDAYSLEELSADPIYTDPMTYEHSVGTMWEYSTSGDKRSGRYLRCVQN